MDDRERWVVLHTPDGRCTDLWVVALSNDPLVEQLMTASYANTSLLYNATANNAPGTVSVNGYTLTINPNVHVFVGKFVLTVSVNDGQADPIARHFSSRIFLRVLTQLRQLLPIDRLAWRVHYRVVDQYRHHIFGSRVRIDITDIVLSGTGATAAIKSNPQTWAVTPGGSRQQSFKRPSDSSPGT